MNTNGENKPYELLNLEIEYPGIKGGVKWAVISDWPMEELMRKYSDELGMYNPVILLSVAEGEVFKEFHKNEHKHEMRSQRTYDSWEYQDGKTEEEKYELMSSYDLEEASISKDYQELREVIDTLPEVQKRRCKLYFYHGFTEKEIAKIEGVDQAAVSRTLAKAIKNIKKFF